jgi:hypothetical protein
MILISLDVTCKTQCNISQYPDPNVHADILSVRIVFYNTVQGILQQLENGDMHVFYEFSEVPFKF